MCFRSVQSILGDGVWRHTGFSHYGVLVVCDERRSTKWPVSALLLRRTLFCVPLIVEPPLNGTTAAFLTRFLKGEQIKPSRDRHVFYINVPLIDATAILLLPSPACLFSASLLPLRLFLPFLLSLIRVCNLTIAGCRGRFVRNFTFNHVQRWMIKLIEAHRDTVSAFSPGVCENYQRQRREKSG